MRKSSALRARSVAAVRLRSRAPCCVSSVRRPLGGGACCDIASTRASRASSAGSSPRASSSVSRRPSRAPVIRPRGAPLPRVPRGWRFRANGRPSPLLRSGRAPWRADAPNIAFRVARRSGSATQGAPAPASVASISADRGSSTRLTLNPRACRLRVAVLGLTSRPGVEPEPLTLVGAYFALEGGSNRPAVVDLASSCR